MHNIVNKGKSWIDVEELAEFSKYVASKCKRDGRGLAKF